MQRKVYSTLLLLAVLVWLGFSNTWASSVCLKLARQNKFDEAGKCYQRKASTMKPGTQLSKFEKSTKGRLLRNGAFAYQQAAKKASKPKLALQNIKKAEALLRAYLNEQLCSRQKRCNLVRSQLNKFRSQSCLLQAKLGRFASSGRCYESLARQMKSGTQLSKFEKSTKGRLVRNAAFSYAKAHRYTSRPKASRRYIKQAITLLRSYLNEQLCTRQSRCNLVIRQLRRFRSLRCRMEARQSQFVAAGLCYSNLAKGMSHGSRLGKFAKSTKGRLLRNGAYAYQKASGKASSTPTVVKRLKDASELLKIYLDEQLCNRASRCELVKKQLLGFRLQIQKKLSEQQALALAKQQKQRRRPPPPRLAKAPPERRVKVAVRPRPQPALRPAARPVQPPPALSGSQKCLAMAQKKQYLQAGQCYQKEANAMKPGQQLNKFEKSTKGRMLKNGAIAFQKASSKVANPQIASSLLEQAIQLLQSYINEKLCSKAYQCSAIQQRLLTLRSRSCGLYAKQQRFFRSGRCYRDIALNMSLSSSLSKFEKLTKGRLLRNGAFAFQKAAQKSTDIMLSSYQWEQGMKLLQQYLQEGLCQKVSRCQLINEQIQQFKDKVQYVQVTVKTTPEEPAYISMEGFRYRTSVAFDKQLRAEVRPGQYTVTVTKAGQPPVQKTIKVDPTQSRNMDVSVPVQTTNLALLQPAPMPRRVRRRRRVARVTPRPTVPPAVPPPVPARAVPQPKVAMAPKTTQPPPPRQPDDPPPTEPTRRPPPPREPEPQKPETREPTPPVRQAPEPRRVKPREFVPEPVPEVRRPTPPEPRALARKKPVKKPKKKIRKKPNYPLTNTGGYVFLGVGSAVVALGAVAAISGYLGTGNAVNSIPGLQQQAQSLSSEERRQLALRDQRALSLRSQYNGSQATFRDGLIVGSVGLAAVIVGVVWVAVVNAKNKAKIKNKLRKVPPSPKARTIGKGHVLVPSWSNTQTLYVSP